MSPHLWCQVPSNPLWLPITQDPDPEPDPDPGQGQQARKGTPPRLLFQEAGCCLSACHLFEIPPPHTPPAVLNWRSERASHWPLTHSRRHHRPSDLGQVPDRSTRASGWLACRRFPPLLEARPTLPCERNIGSSLERVCGSGLAWSATRQGPARRCAPRYIVRRACQIDRLSHAGRHRCQSNLLSKTD